MNFEHFASKNFKRIIGLLIFFVQQNNLLSQPVIDTFNSTSGNKINESTVTIFGCIPYSGTIGTVFTITGNDFKGASAVTIGDIPASSFTIVNDTTIKAVVGGYTTRNVIAVTTPNGTGMYYDFSLWPLHTFAAFNPTVALEGEQVIIYGDNLIGVTEVSFGGTPAKSFYTYDRYTIYAVVGKGSSGSVSITRYGATVSRAGFKFYAEPKINSYSPATGTIGATITITGTDFNDASSVSFGNVPATTFKVVNSTTITATIDTGATGDIVVVTPGGTAKIGGFAFTVPPAPDISNFSPASAGTGTTVNIYGNNFLSTSSVQFGGIEATEFKIVSGSSIQAKVSNGATGSISVTTPGGKTLKGGFIFNAPPLISSFSPVSGQIGSLVNISGSNFNSLAQNNIVYFGAVKATVLSGTSNSLTVKVPLGATFDPITVTTGSYTTNSLLPFLVKFPGAGAVFTSNSFKKLPEIPVGVDPGEIAYGDLDGDGKIDLAVVNESSISVFRNTSSPGAISFAAKIDIQLNDLYVNDVLIKDVDGDGKLDLIIGTGMSNDNLGILTNISTPGNISFSNRINIFTGSYISGLEVVDLNEDGKPDLIVAASHVVSIFRNTGTIGLAAFKKDVEMATGIYPGTIAVVDINNDGKSDIAVIYGGNSTSPASFSIYKNVSLQGSPFTSSSFVSVVNRTIGFNENTFGLVVKDFDGDGYADIAISNNPSINSGIPHTISVYKNTGNTNLFSFAARVNYEPNEAPAELAAADMDGDGKIDLVLANFSDGIISIFKNKSQPGTITLEKKSDYPVAGQIVNLCLTDLDNDGHLDIATPDYSDETLCILRNMVTEPIVVPSGTNPVSGNVESKLTFDTVVQTYAGIPYVQRHYDITPINNPATATASVTLYYSQQDFDNFNAHPDHGLNLPASADDNQGKSNLRIYQYHGFSSTSLPGSYSGSAVEINPDDNKIIWNSITQLWEVTFNVTGFSGFFLGSSGKSLITSVIVIDNTHYIKLNPNPVTTQLWLHYNLPSVYTVNIEVFDMQGKKVLSKKQVSSGSNISVNTLPASVYYMRVTEPQNKRQYLFKFVKQ